MSKRADFKTFIFLLFLINKLENHIFNFLFLIFRKMKTRSESLKKSQVISPTQNQDKKEKNH